MSATDDHLQATGRVEHCGAPMRIRRDGTRWSGEDEIRTVRMTCETCGAVADLVVTTPVGPPGATS